ncbi:MULTISPECIES: IclR family transcriptional regulator [Pseudonocardia]|uniref:DNA-binding transcriptional activator MhpR n=2 Tax=Pseudonocardia TaxID=1847 RepID=A0A1Y2MYU7_PSEAH|nr:MULTISPECIES: helix-turn-helix domain-containing protein [Pseudonocardia]OSY40386.1 DNA-binding transcriptional activator MhpR [Pseudonocardia autotrophica]TDN72283.1 DNA-binding IclR family transcriptional regulator [Pseudonocardia autotrophica]BBG02995.1 hypothetical protein Pdca_42040 [Pseudonocardia autotrophica]GEC25103.1 hypothetical protein PSA01_21320 [Pseudonocardia saturnea]
MATVDIQSVDRVGMILGLFGPHREAVSPAEAAELIGLNRTTTYRYLNSLVAANVLELRPDRLYAPGPILMQLGAFAFGRRDIAALAAEPMADLARATQITSVLSLWGASSPVVAVVSEPPQREIVVTVRVGMQLGWSTAQSLIFHAFRFDDSRVHAAARALDEADRELLHDRARSVRERGHASQVSPRGIAVLSVPVHDDRGMAASLALLSTRDVLDIDDDSEYLAQLSAAADTISASMGAPRRDR